MPNSATPLRQPERGVQQSQIVQSLHAGVVPIAKALRWQEARAQQIADGSAPEIALFLQHEPVYTQGRRGGREHVLAPLSTLPAPVLDTDRGGDITWHGPGQLVVWPLLRVRARGIGISRYVHCLEEAAERAAAEFGVEAGRVRGKRGLWLGPRKLASVGVRVQGGISRHGLALNCDVDLNWFSPIRACGIEGAAATSLTAELGRPINVDECAPQLEKHLADVFGLRFSPVRSQELS